MRFILTILLLFFAGGVEAQEINHFSTLLPKGTLSELNDLALDYRLYNFRQSKTISLNTPGGPVQVELVPNEIRRSNYRELASGGSEAAESFSEVSLFRGNIVGAVSGDFLRIAIFAGASGSLELRGTLRQGGDFLKVSARHGADIEEIALDRLSSSELAGLSHACGSLLQGDDLHLDVPGAVRESSTRSASATTTILEIATEADFEFFQSNSSSVALANAEIISILNAVDAIFQAELGISIAVVLQNVWTTSADPYTIASGGDGDSLLGEFRSYWNANFLNSVDYDVAHFWTTRSFRSGGQTVIGLAYPATACDNVIPVSKYSMSQWENSNRDTVVVAHELGHNISSSTHDEARGYSCSGSEYFIMCSSITPTLDTFSPLSKTEVANYVGSVSCLSDGGSGQNRAPSLVPPGAANATEGQLFTFQMQGSDPDLDALSYSAPNGLPAGAVLDPSSGLFSWTPASGQAGVYNIDVRVADPLGLSDTETLNLTVAAGSGGGNPSSHTRGDLSGDGKAEPVVYRGSVGFWYSGNFVGSNLVSQQFGLPGDVPILMDYDGDNKSDRAVFRPSNSTWYIRGSNSAVVVAVTFGLAGDIPTTGDFDGDGRDDIAVYRPSQRFFIYRKSSDGVTDVVTTLGSVGDLPVSCDYDGDGISDRASWNPTTGVWTVNFSQSSSVQQFQWGLPTDFPVPADFDGDGNCDRAVWRPSTGEWYVEGGATVQFGLGGDVPIPLDFDGDGSADFAVWRPALGIWFRRNSIGQAEIRQLGLYYDSVAGAAALYNGIRNADGDGTTSDYLGKVSRVDAYSVSQGNLYAISPDNVFQYAIGAPSGSYILRGDYNGDGSSDIASITNGIWAIRFLNSGGGLLSTTTRAWGVASDIPISADFDGDGETDIAVYRPLGSIGYSQWFVILSRDNSVRTYNWGLPGDVPLAADYNGDGVDDPAVWRALDGVWYTLDGRSGMPLVNAQWGLPGDQPLTADVDRDGRADRIVYRSSDGNWYTFFSGGGVSIRSHNVGGATPVATLFGDADAVEFLLYRVASPVVFRLNATTGQTSSTDASPPTPNSGTVLSRSPYQPVS